jgi:esterase/lipase superfamily enzyme
LRTFYLYINNQLVGVAQDDDPLPIVNNMAVFVRGNAKCMFENVYALTDNYSQNTSFSLSGSDDAPIHSAFGEVDLNADSSFRKYAVSGLIQSTYLSGISSVEPPKYKIYFEEFGTIMREAAYFDARYDKAYPALSAQISPALTRIKGYTVSGFTAGAYGAEFLVFNHTDTILNLDSSSGNYLRIQGVALTGQSENELTVDDFFDKKSSFSSPVFIEENIVDSPVDFKQNYIDIKLSRLTQGRKDFNIEAPYIQTQDSAFSLMEWLTDRIMKPKRSIGIDVFGMPILQLGDIVELDYKSKENFEELAPEGTRFVIYNIEYTRGFSNLAVRVFLSEVPK